MLVKLCWPMILETDPMTVQMTFTVYMVIVGVLCQVPALQLISDYIAWWYFGVDICMLRGQLMTLILPGGSSVLIPACRATDQ